MGWYRTGSVELDIKNVCARIDPEGGGAENPDFSRPVCHMKGNIVSLPGAAFSRNVEASRVNPRLTCRTPEPWAQRFLILGVGDEEDERLDWPLRH